MVGWLVAVILAVVAVLAFSLARAGHKREIRDLREAQRATRTEEAAEHQRQLKRLRREGEDLLRRAHHPLVRDLLPAVDGLDQALEQMKEAGLTDYEEGLRGALLGIERALLSHGVQAVDPTPGDPFDPHYQQAIARRESADQTPQTIALVHRRGFADDDQVLRPALVEVFVAPPAPAEDQELSEEEPSADEELPEDESFSVGSVDRSSSVEAPPGNDSEP